MNDGRIAEAAKAVRSRERLWYPLSGLVVVAVAVYGTGLVVGGLWRGLLVVAPPSSPVKRHLANDLFLQDVLGKSVIAIVAVAWLRYRLPEARSVSRLLNVDRPSFRDAPVVIVGVAGMLAAVLGLQALYAELGIEYARSSGLSTADRWPWLHLVQIPVAIIFVGPAEELLFRRGLQDRLRDAYSPAASVVLASVLFAVVHLIGSYTGTGALASIGIVFLLSLFLGALYAAVDDLLVVAAVHGLFDALVALLNYL